LVLQKFLAASFGLFFFTLAHAGNNTHFPTGKAPSFSDSTGIDDSLKQSAQLGDTKKEFREVSKNSTFWGDNSRQKFNPEMTSFIEDYSLKFSKKLEGIKDHSKPYLDVMDNILEEHGLPGELKYLAVIESDLKTNARSWAGAVGPWQFMPETGRNMGLRVNKQYDERRDFTKSTRAACKYLSGLFDLYGDWLLVIAAYNSGPGKVNAAIKKSGSRDFWTLQRYLPAESQSHVKKFLATRYVMEGSIEESKKITPLTPEEIAASTIQHISGRYNSSVIAKHIIIDIELFNKMNPDFEKLIGSNGTYELRLPSDKMEIFLAQKPGILNESIQLLLNPVNGTN
jgi:membrane-bound lytic murein transglycosylase D